MMTGWLQIKPEPKTNKLTLSGLLLVTTQLEISRGTIICVNDQEEELKEGDEVFFGKDMVETAELNGETVHLLRKASVFCKIENNELVPINNMVMLTIDTSKVRPESTVSQFILDANEQPIKTEYFTEAFDAAPKRSKVYAFPKVITGGNGQKEYLNDLKVEKGDYVYHHHLASNDRFKIVFNDEEIFWQEINQIFAVEKSCDVTLYENGTDRTKIEKRTIVIPLERYVFVQPIEEDESSIKTKSGIFLKEKAGFVPVTGILKYCSPYAKLKGFQEGSIVKFADRAKYEIVVKGQLLYKTRFDNIYAGEIDACEVINTKKVA